MIGRHERPNGSPLSVLALVVGYALIHSLLASRIVKGAAKSVLGRRHFDGLYRSFYIVQATGLTVYAIRLFMRLPDREIYRARAPWSYVLGAIQLAGLALLTRAVSVVGFARITGLENALALFRGEEPPPAPEAQGPPPSSDGGVDARGPFRVIRHPDNLPIILVFWAFPTLTVNRLTLAMASTIYAVLGSCHEDSRLRALYGKPFANYCRRVPMMLPRLPSARKEARGNRPAADDPLRGLAIAHQRIRGSGVDLHVSRCGEGPPVILLHGFPENWRSWRHQIPDLVRGGFSIWALDLRGYNRSDRPLERGAYHLRHLVEDVAAVVCATGHSRAHVVGHDWGGIIAWTFAGVHHELTGKLAILNAPHMRIFLRRVRRPPQLLQSWYVLFFQLPRLPELALLRGDSRMVREIFRRAPAREAAFTDEEIDGYVASLSEPGALTAALNYYRDNFRSDALQFASAAECRAETLVIWGEKDFALSLGLLDGLEEVAPNVRVHRIPEAGHWVQNEAPDEVNQSLLSFLQN